MGASRRGASRIAYTSHQAASERSQFAPQLVHADAEAHLAGRGVPFTSLRDGFSASSLGFIIGDALTTGLLVAPEDGPVSWTARTDLAEAAAVALTAEGPLTGVTAPLTAPEALDLHGVAALLSDITGRTVTRVVVSDEHWLQAAAGRGVPRAASEYALGMFRAARQGQFDVTDPTLESVIGRGPGQRPLRARGDD